MDRYLKGAGVCKFCTKSSTTLIYKLFFTEHEMRFHNQRNLSVKLTN